MKKTGLSALLAAGLLAGGMSIGANAADFGGDCCADLEERIAEGGALEVDHDPDFVRSLGLHGKSCLHAHHLRLPGGLNGIDIFEPVLTHGPEMAFKDLVQILGPGGRQENQSHQ